MSLESFVHQWKEVFRFKSIKPDDRSIVFYAEDTASWRYFEPIIDELLITHGKRICYVTSSPSDPVLRREDSRIQAFSIGSGLARTVWFLFLQADVMVMTMPDLGTYHIKRSKYPVHYVYVYHSIISSHMAYRPKAFDHFDSILCVGPHHRDEIRAAEQLYGLKPKTLVDAGYGIVDSILASKESMIDGPPQATGAGKRVLIAPSWGEHGLIETRGPELVQVILEAGHRVTVRPHRMTMRQRPKLLKELQERFSSNPNFLLDTDLRSQGTIHSSDIMISDWSGAALEYAFGLERPVLFVDVPKKVNNPDYEKIGYVPVEVQVRPGIGEVMSPDRLSEIPVVLDRLFENPEIWQERIRELRSRWIYNVGNSGRVAAAYIAQAAASSSAPESQAVTGSGRL